MLLMWLGVWEQCLNPTLIIGSIAAEMLTLHDLTYIYDMTFLFLPNQTHSGVLDVH